jgi:hypothetical protein
MDLNRILNMIINTVLRRAVNGAINTGVNHLASKGKKPADMTPAEHAQASSARDLAKRARKAARVTRRLGR